MKSESQRFKPDMGTPDQQRALLLDLIQHVKWASEGDDVIVGVADIRLAVDAYMKWNGLIQDGARTT